MSNDSEQSVDTGADPADPGQGSGLDDLLHRIFGGLKTESTQILVETLQTSAPKDESGLDALLRELFGRPKR